MSAQQMQQLVDMGATRAQAKRALQDHDVNEAAERIFEGKYDDVIDEDEDISEPETARDVRRPSRIETPPTENDDDDEELIDDGEVEDFADYDSEPEITSHRHDGTGIDPYAGIFFSKDRREEVIEVEETPEFVKLDGKTTVPVMTQGEWMKGCPEGGEQGLLFQLYSKLSNEPCLCPNDCGYSVARDKALFFALLPKFPDYASKLRDSVQHSCPKCKVQFCLACGERVDPQKAAISTYDPLLHCPDLQGVILGIGLATLEHVYSEHEGTGASPPDSSLSNKKKRKADDTPADTTEEDDDESVAPIKKAKGGTGYAGTVKEDTRGQTEALLVQQSRDEEIGTLLSQIRVFLPSLTRPGGAQTSDYLVHPTALAHLRRRFNLVSSSLLRNDSLADMSDRAVLYFELFEWLETISNHEALASMMGMPIMVVASITPLKPQATTGSSKRSTKARPALRERTIVYEGSSGPRELMESIVIQAQAAIKGLGGMVQELPLDQRVMTEEEKRKTTQDDMKGKGKGKAATATATVSIDENFKLRTFCERIITTAAAVDRSLRETKGVAFVERLHASLPRISSSVPRPLPSSTGNQFATIYDDLAVGPTEKDTENTYVEWASRVRFEYCDLTIQKPDMVEGESPHYRHVFSSEIRMLANSDIPKRSLAIAKELAVLTTNLPVAWDSSVFLRVDETRVDVIKALIIGPEGTPYQNGCYLFDIFLGPTYNNIAPSVKYITTNGGKFRFNPNLYADGKVCLSLLGTWSGPGWVSGKSTLLQVLISIQSMILNDEPYLNEPGWATMGGTPQSKAYSANVRRLVVHTAMLGNLKAPPPPFEDIIRTHFRLKATSIEKQLNEWLALDDGKAVIGENQGNYNVRSATDPASGSKTVFQQNVDELKALLHKLNAPRTTRQ